MLLVNRYLQLISINSVQSASSKISHLFYFDTLTRAIEKMNFPKNLVTSYSKFVASNAETCSDLETLSKYMSYFVSGMSLD